MPTLPEVEDQLRMICVNPGFGINREVSHLPRVLAEGEVIRQALSGVMGGSTFLIVCSDRRLIMLNAESVSLSLMGFPLPAISSVEHTVGFVHGEIAITANGKRVVLTRIERRRVQPFIDALNAARANMSRFGSPARPRQSNGDVVDELERLRDRGVLAEAEVAEQRRFFMHET